MLGRLFHGKVEQSGDLRAGDLGRAGHGGHGGAGQASNLSLLNGASRVFWRSIFWSGRCPDLGYNGRETTSSRQPLPGNRCLVDDARYATTISRSDAAIHATDLVSADCIEWRQWADDVPNQLHLRV